MNKEKIFGQGIIFKKPREGAPEFVKGNISVKVDEFIGFLRTHNNNGWVNLDLKKSKEGKYYIELNTYKKETKFVSDSKELSEEEKKFIQDMRNKAKKTFDPEELSGADINFDSRESF